MKNCVKYYLDNTNKYVVLENLSDVFFSLKKTFNKNPGN